MIPLAHVGGVPLEELLAGAAGGGGALFVTRVWLAAHLRRRRLPQVRAGVASSSRTRSSAPSLRER